MSLSLNATVSFSIPIKQASNWDGAYVKQHYHLINTLKLSWSTSFTSIKTFHDSQISWLLYNQNYAIKSQHSSRSSVTSNSLLKKKKRERSKKATQHFLWHASAWEWKELGQYQRNLSTVGEANINTSPLKEHQCICWRSRNKSAEQTEILELQSSHSSLSQFPPKSKGRPVSQTFIPAHFYLRLFFL